MRVLTIVFVLFFLQFTLVVQANNESIIGEDWYSTDMDEIYGLSDTKFLLKNNSHIQIFDVKNMSVIDETACSGFVRLNALGTIVMCSNGIYSISNTSFTMTYNGPINRFANPTTNQTIEFTGNYQSANQECVKPGTPYGKIEIFDNSSLNKTITVSYSHNINQYRSASIKQFYLHEDEPKISLVVMQNDDQYWCAPSQSWRIITFNYSSTNHISIGSCSNCIWGTHAGDGVPSWNFNDIQQGAVSISRPGPYYDSIALYQNAEYANPSSTEYDIASSRIFCEISAKEVGVTGDFVTLNSIDYPVTDTPTSISCNSNYNASMIIENRIVTLWNDEDKDQYNDLEDAFPFIDSQWSDFDNDGYGDNPGGISPDSCPSVPGTSYLDMYGCIDSDFDGYSNSGDAFPQDWTQVNDSDQDGFGDNLSGFQGDDCPSVFGTSSRNNTYGCPDSDYDGWADFQDAFENDSSQWKDRDGDGFGDQINGFAGDECVDIPGTSYIDRFGCIDADGDGVSDKNDAFPNNPSQTDDRDGDGYGDNQSELATQVDYFPSDTTQWNDTDGDGYGDNQNGNLPDRFPNDPTRWSDSDHDGVADEDDEFPDDGTQFADTDGDGYGDDPNGNRADAFPNDPEEWLDTDGDGLGNNADAFPFDPTQTEDRDGDGMGDNPMGIGADKFPDDITQWGDIDGDGYGDNQTGNNPDAFPTDATQWSDVDGDGYGDNPTGRLPDAFPNDPTQWEDLDGDGLGDNLTGNNADPYLFDFDNDGYNDSIDPLPKLASPGDLDNDGVPDEDDLFPDDYREWADFDGDGEGDNADTDDDNDGWTDTDEARQGTDPFSSASQPVDSFEIVIPGTAIGLGAWDLIGIFGGVPLFAWIGFGFATRNARTARYEEMLRGAQSIEDLEQVSHMWEYSLMMRMLGPHQGIRLERLRADLEYEFSGQRRISIVHESTDQTELVSKEVPALQTSEPVSSIPATQITEDGYEWLDYDGQKYYRLTGSATDWIKFE